MIELKPITHKKQHTNEVRDGLERRGREVDFQATEATYAQKISSIEPRSLTTFCRFRERVRFRPPPRANYCRRCVPTLAEGQPAPESWPSVAAMYIAHLADGKFLASSYTYPNPPLASSVLRARRWVSCRLSLCGSRQESGLTLFKLIVHREEVTPDGNCSQRTHARFVAISSLATRHTSTHQAVPGTLTTSTCSRSTFLLVHCPYSIPMSSFSGYHPAPPNVVPVCEFFNRGNCMNGNQCRFTHIVSQTAEPIASSFYQPPPPKVCSFFLKGQCSNGDSCRFLHPVTLYPPTDVALRKAAPVPRVPTRDSAKGGAPEPRVCAFFSQGRCTSGATCMFLHYTPSLSPSAAEHDDEARPNYAKAAAAGGGGDDGRGPCRYGEACTAEGCPFAHDDRPVEASYVDGVQKGVVSEADGSFRVRLVGTTDVSFGPGASVISVRPSSGGSSCLVAINGLHAEKSPDEQVKAAVSRYGLLVSFDRPNESYALALFAERKGAEDCVAAIDGRSLTVASAVRDCKRGQQGTDTLSVRILAEPGGPAPVQAHTIKISWYSPTRLCFLHFSSQKAADRAAMCCDGKKPPGASAAVSAKVQVASRGARIFSVTLSGVEESADSSLISRFVKSATRNVTPSNVLLHAPSFKGGNRAVEAILQTGVAVSAEKQHEQGRRERVAGRAIEGKEVPRRGGLEGFIPGSFTVLPGVGQKVKAVARFESAAQASRAVSSLTAQGSQPTLGGQVLRAEQVVSAKFTFLNGMYSVLRDRVEELLALGGPSLQRTVHSGPVSTTLKIRGLDPKAMLETKRLLDRAIQGERFVETSGGLRCVPVWSPYFGHRSFDADAAEIERLSGAFVLRDTRRRELRLFGNSSAIERAKQAIKGFVSDCRFVRLSSFSSRRHFSNAKNRPEGCLYDPSRSVLIVHGAATAELLASSVTAMEEAWGGQGAGRSAEYERPSDGGECPVCYCPPEEGSTLRLSSCGHSYCKECFESWIGQGHFPLNCLTANCAQPVTMTELSTVLGDGFLPLLRLALDEHVNSHVESLRFCITPDCPQVYALDGERMVYCSTCALAICTRCHVEEHGGLTCAEYAKSKAPADKIRNYILEEILTMKCPRCTKAFFDFTGCFSVSCGNCPCSFCGWCLKDCGSDAHSHVAHCPAKPKGADVYFGSLAQFVEAQRLRQHRLLTEYFGTLDVATRLAASRSCESDLKDLGLSFEY